MNIRDLEYLVALRQHRHFGRAASACFVSQPTLSMQIKKLEAGLGVPLIERSPRSVLFTPVGEAVVERARMVLNQVSDIESIARRARDPRSGSVKIGIFPTLGPYLVPHVLPSWKDTLPELDVLLIEEKTAELLRQLHAGSLDAVIVAGPIGAEGVVVEPLFTEPFDLALPVGQAEAADGGPVDSSALHGADLLLLDDGHCLRDQALDVCQAVGARERDGFRATSLETLRYMVAAGTGMTLLPRLATLPPVPPVPGLAIRRFAEPGPHREIVCLWRSSSTHAGVLTELAATARHQAERLLDQCAH